MTSRLKDHFLLLLVHPRQAIHFLQHADMVMFRNTGSVIGYPEEFNDFLKAVEQNETFTFNSFDGKADVKGKQYLLDLTSAGYPVIPTIEKREDIHRLGHAETYIVKLKNGADSIGMERVERRAADRLNLHNRILQPYIDFEYEVSFYYINHEFIYAMYAPDKRQRWQMVEFHPEPSDIAFADQFVKWNKMTRGITRIDTCRMPDQSLLLMELEDLNPYLSIQLLPEKKQSQFIDRLIEVLKAY